MRASRRRLLPTVRGDVRTSRSGPCTGGPLEQRSSASASRIRFESCAVRHPSSPSEHPDARSRVPGPGARVLAKPRRLPHTDAPSGRRHTRRGSHPPPSRSADRSYDAACRGVRTERGIPPAAVPPGVGKGRDDQVEDGSAGAARSSVQLDERPHGESGTSTSSPGPPCGDRGGGTESRYDPRPEHRDPEPPRPAGPLPSVSREGDGPRYLP